VHVPFVPLALPWYRLGLTINTACNEKGLFKITVWLLFSKLFWMNSLPFAVLSSHMLCWVVVLNKLCGGVDTSLPHIVNSSLVDLHCIRELFAEHNGFSTAHDEFYCPTAARSFILPADVTGACDVVGLHVLQDCVTKSCVHSTRYSTSVHSTACSTEDRQ
jgi:hypothetical protein